ncbi:MAG: bifunctional metallophosphatase/5'-nucleotidase [Bacteroidales bacterium]|jgi:5'-nucleotidase|nr:bifunctional metallophosphatase/5'-nucleotidase [Bacteroidales bacterium]
MRQKLILLFAATLITVAAKPTTIQKERTDMTSKTTITILQTADIHGQLDKHQELFVEKGEVVFKERGGLSVIKTIFEEERAKNPGRTIVVDGGDLIQGSGYAAASEGKIFSDIVREMNYDLVMPGNWEVVYGKEIMLEVMKRYNTAIIAQNMRHEADGKNLFPPYWIREIDGIKVGFIGINDPDIPFRQAPSYSRGILFNGVDRKVEETIEKVKFGEKADIVILLTHIGLAKQVDLANNPISRHVDYILGNDTHERIRKPIQGRYARVMEPGAFGSFVGKLTLHFENGQLISDEYDLIEVDPVKYPKDKALQSLIDKKKAAYEEELEKVVGYTSEPIYRYLVVENAMDNMITDAMRWKTGVDISFSNGFRFGNPIVPQNGAPAPITRNDIWNMLPIDDYVKTGEVTGEQLQEWLEKEAHNVFAQNPTERFGGWFVRFSGMEVRLNSSSERGSRIESVVINGEPLDLNRSYTISACTREGDPEDMLCRMKNVKNVASKSYTMHDAVIDYLRAFSPVAPRLDGRAVATDLGPFNFSTLPGTDYQFR